jgi:hypothetical protein
VSAGKERVSIAPGKAGHLDEIQGGVISTLSLLRNGASQLANFFGVGFINWLGVLPPPCENRGDKKARTNAKAQETIKEK